MLPKINPTETNIWEYLVEHFLENEFDLRTLFAENPQRFEEFSVKRDNYLFDYSKNLINSTTMEYLLRLAEETKVKEAINLMFSGEKINETENKAVLHTALRDFSDKPIFVDGEDVKPKIKRVLSQMRLFSEKVISGEYRGFSGEKITDVVNIGIGGSDLGPVMVCSALKHYKTRLNTHFISNVDGNHLAEVLKNLNPETTLFIVASKTFSTQETITNAFSAKKWFLQKATEEDVAKHFVALSTNIDAVKSFGIAEENIFEFWDWVGGRYSLWSAIGLSIVLSIGYDNFEKLLKGANETDVHFQTAEFSQNIPILMALLGIWYRNFAGASSYAVLPYSQYLERFPAYLQQTDMESNGKFVDRNGDFVNYEAGTIIWGEAGTNGQHSFYQLLHQGTELIPADFIAFVRSCNVVADHQEKLLANFFAQTEALAFGKNEDEVYTELKQSGNTDDEIYKILSYKVFQGNSPTNSLLIDELTPYSLGQLIALYEHKIFVQGVIWNVYSFDQFGVELGKVLANKILPELHSDDKIDSHDSSTNGLINYFKEKRI
jgi:glucose-6-phosphate isomerase